MKVNNRNIRELHVGKNKEEKADYTRLLNSDFVFDKTYEESPDTNKTNSTTVEETNDVVSPRVRKKSWLLYLRDGDFLKNAYVMGVIVTLACLVIWGYITMAIEQGTQRDKIKSLEETTKANSAAYTELRDYVNGIETTLSVFKEGVSKDVNYIRAIIMGN